MCRECRERFPRHRLQRKPLVSDPGMHHGTCIAHVPWCMSRSLTRGGGENVPGIPDACATHNFTYLIRGPWEHMSHPSHWNPFWDQCVFMCTIFVGNLSSRPVSGGLGFISRPLRTSKKTNNDFCAARCLIIGRGVLLAISHNTTANTVYIEVGHRQNGSPFIPHASQALLVVWSYIMTFWDLLAMFCISAETFVHFVTE